MAQAHRYCMPDPLGALTDEIIMEHIRPGSRVIDLGCGDGRLLEKLRDSHGCSVQGVELDLSGFSAVIGRGIPALRMNLDDGLDDIPDNAFDAVVLGQTLQQVRHPKDLLLDMLRIAGRALVVLPNFGYWRVRWEVLRKGRAPITSSLPYEWYDTPNLHFMSMHDFRSLVEGVNLKIVHELPIIRGRAVDRAFASNLRADSALYVLERGSLKMPGDTPPGQ
jgi:methionine biosynthesis protein MetW